MKSRYSVRRCASSELTKEFKEKLSSIAELAVGDACTGSNPRPITPAEMERLFTCIYYGEKVDF